MMEHWKLVMSGKISGLVLDMDCMWDRGSDRLMGDS